MPSINQSLAEHINGFVPAEPEPVPHSPSLLPEPVVRSPFLRCPCPPLGPISPDNLDQFNLHGGLPQYRVFVGR